MKIKHIFSSRKSRRARDSPKMRKQREKYPLLVEKILKTSDIILEVLDARFVSETRNFESENEIKKQNKKIIYVLNKSDLVKKIKKEFLKEMYPFVLVSCRTREGVKKLRSLIKKESRKTIKRPDDEKITVGVIGYPNTGKSSLINILIGKNSAKTGAEAGFTKGLQKIKLTSDITLLDTPGVIPKEEYSNFEKEKISKNVIVGGRSYSQIKDPELVVADLIKKFGKIVEEHYKIESGENSEIFLEQLGKKLNFLKKGGEINFDRTARKVLKDWQDGTIKI